ncbi:MAG: hypothetical protein ACT4N4_05940 [Rhodospirillales bacterium]
MSIRAPSVPLTPRRRDARLSIQPRNLEEGRADQRAARLSIQPRNLEEGRADRRAARIRLKCKMTAAAEIALPPMACI